MGYCLEIKPRLSLSVSRFSSLDSARDCNLVSLSHFFFDVLFSLRLFERARVYAQWGKPALVERTFSRGVFLCARLSVRADTRGCNADEKGDSSSAFWVYSRNRIKATRVTIEPTTLKARRDNDGERRQYIGG